MPLVGTKGQNPQTIGGAMLGGCRRDEDLSSLYSSKRYLTTNATRLPTLPSSFWDRPSLQRFPHVTLLSFESRKADHHTHAAPFDVCCATLPRPPADLAIAVHTTSPPLQR